MNIEKITQIVLGIISALGIIGTAVISLIYNLKEKWEIKDTETLLKEMEKVEQKVKADPRILPEKKQEMARELFCQTKNYSTKQRKAKKEAICKEIDKLILASKSELQFVQKNQIEEKKEEPKNENEENETVTVFEIDESGEIKEFEEYEF